MAQMQAGFHPVQEQDLFDLEYWSLEQAKVGKAKSPAMQGKLSLSLVELAQLADAIATEFHAAGAEIMLVDKDAEQLEQVRSQIDPRNFNTAGRCNTTRCADPHYRKP